jgi:sarcosine oxidase/L-pipecolate oxidase
MAELTDPRYTENFMADLAYESLGIWDELERDAGEGALRLMTGLLNFGNPEYGAGGPEGNHQLPQKICRF